MSILPKKPSNETVSLKNVVSRLVEDSFFLPQALLAYWNGDRTIPLDVYEEDDNLMIKASLPGIKAEDLHIEVHRDVLTISGQTQQETKRKEEDYILNERHYGQFKRSVVLPYNVQVDQVEAEFEDGILTLILPKMVATKGKKVSIKPKVKAEKPEMKAEKPEKKAETPEGKGEKPVTKAEKPEAITEQPKAKVEKPKAKTVKPKAKAENPQTKAVQPEANGELSEAKDNK